MQSIKRILIAVGMILLSVFLLQNINDLALAISLDFYYFGALTLPIGIWFAFIFSLGFIAAILYELPKMLAKTKELKQAKKELIQNTQQVPIIQKEDSNEDSTPTS